MKLSLPVLLFFFNIGFAPILNAMVVAYVTTPKGTFELELYDNGKGMVSIWL